MCIYIFNFKFNLVKIIGPMFMNFFNDYFVAWPRYFVSLKTSLPSIQLGRNFFNCSK